MLGRCAFGEYAELLGYPIKPGARRTLYLAMDRPQQAARSFRRMVGEGWRSELDDRLAPGLLTDLTPAVRAELRVTENTQVCC